MASKKHKNFIHGWLPIIKPVGIASAAVVATVKRLTGAHKVGHAGTLDPLASGIILIALGAATKTVPYAMELSKTYKFIVRWGISTDTDDSEGSVVKKSDVRPNKADIKTALKMFVGETLQPPPIYSAIKIKGKRAYKLAREGKPILLKPRTICISRLNLVSILDDNNAEFEVVSGKGMYVRALGRDLALKLGTYGHIRRLDRISIGHFNKDNSVEYEFLKQEMHDKGSFVKNLLKPVEAVLGDVLRVVLTEREAHKMLSGQSVSFDPIARRSEPLDFSSGRVISAMYGGRLIALGKINSGHIHPFRVLSI